MNLTNWRQKYGSLVRRLKANTDPVQLERFMVQYRQLGKEISKELLEAEQRQYAENLISFEAKLWFSKVFAEFKKAYPDYTTADLQRLNKLLTKLLVNTHSYFVKAAQETLSMHFTFSGSLIAVPLILKLISVVLDTTNPVVSCLIAFLTTFSGYLLGHEYGGKDAPPVTMILTSPHLDVANLKAIMTHNTKKAFFADLAERADFAEQMVTSLSSNWRLLYDAGICATQCAFAESIRASLVECLELIGAIIEFGSKYLGSALSWIGLGSAVTMTESVVNDGISTFGLKGLAAEIGRFGFVSASRLPFPTPESFAPSSLNPHS